MPLDPAPATPIRDGAPAFGTYRGCCDRTSLHAVDRGFGRLHRAWREKHWQYFAVADAHTAVGGAIVDAGLFATAFCWVADRATRTLVADVARVRPPGASALSEVPARGRVARWRLGRDPLRLERDDDAVVVQGHLGHVRLDLTLEAPPARALTAICPVAGAPEGAVNVTQKELAERVEGRVVAGGTRRTLTEGVGLLDHTHGLLARETRWRWAFGVGIRDGRVLGFNLVSSFNDGLENVRWEGGEPEPLGAARIEPAPVGGAGSWRARTEGGSADLRLDVEAERIERVELGLLASDYRSPIGAWRGRLGDRDVDGLFGGAEAHRARW